ncbi:hypothetical protein GOODEAATRI_002579 [Goodea atripinnis]|uniref:Rap guanine nucleotide exchange factor 2 n=1 Tax=Goodea atripinnis TaxID=208336 RepID=A0ABV0N7B5_9TELE
MDLSGLPETAVDSEEDDDEEDIERASDPLMSRDIVRDCLEKDPMDRTDDDIGLIMLGIKQIVMVCTCLHGWIAGYVCDSSVGSIMIVVMIHCEARPPALVFWLGQGEMLKHACQERCLPSHSPLRVKPLTVFNGKFSSPTCCSRRLSPVVQPAAQVTLGSLAPTLRDELKRFEGTPERLTMHLVEEHSVVDPTYIEDFLLTYRTFLSSPMVVGKKLLEWFHDPSLRDKEHDRKNGAPHLPKIGDIKKASRYSIPDLAVDVEQVMGLEKASKKAKSNTVGGRNKLKKIFDKTLTSILPPKPYNDVCVGQSQDDSIVGMKPSKQIPPALPVSGNLSSSNPDLLQSHHRILDFNNQPGVCSDVVGLNMSDQVLRVFKADQQSRYIMIGKDTTAKDVVAQAIREFALTAAPEAYSLCEDLLREGQISLLQLSTVEVATQLSMRAFELFCAIEPTEYIDDLFKLRSKTGSFSLKRFEESINHETFWVATEVVREPNQLKRMKIIKHFIKIALHCRECKNFNSMFAIISGLNLAPVSRLRGTWEKLPSKYEKLFGDLQDLFDPSRNMAKYRNVLNNQNLQPPIIPLFPVIKKDLTFLHEGNDSKVDGLVNFEKLRMIAKEIRHVGRMASVNMDPALMFRTRMLVGNDQTLLRSCPEQPRSNGASWPKGTKPCKFPLWPSTHPGKECQSRICHPLEERRLRHSGGVCESHMGGPRLERRATTDPDQYSLGLYSSMQDCRGIYAGCPTVLSSPSSEELTQDQGDRVSLDAADSGRGSWTSCSSGSHDNIQNMQQGRSWEIGIGGLSSASEALLGGPAALWAAQARGSWASACSSSSSAAYWGEESEGDTGTIKRRGGKDVNADPETSSITSTGSEEAKQLGRPSPSPITAGARKEGRYREPPPTPPGYTALTISDLAEGQHPPPPAPTSTATHSSRRPPDYTTALQRSRMVTQSPDSHQAHQAAKHRGGSLRRTRSPADEQEPEDEEEGESLSPKLVALRKPLAQHTPGTPRS